MTLPYGALKCRISDWKLTTLKHRKSIQYHLNVLVDTGVEKQRIAINVGTNNPDDVMVYREVDPFTHPLLDNVAAFPFGLHALYTLDKLPALDFLRSDISGEPSEFTVGAVADNKGKAEPSLTLIAWLTEAKEKHFPVVAFGRYWDDSQKKGEHASPKYWDEESGRGIHDIHMNQGSSGDAYTSRDDDKDHNETWQDGALFFQTDTGWRAFFSAFSGQLTPTDDETGNPTDDATPVGAG